MSYLDYTSSNLFPVRYISDDGISDEDESLNQPLSSTLQEGNELHAETFDIVNDIMSDVIVDSMYSTAGFIDIYS